MTNSAPTAKRVPHERTHHGDTVTDEYAWLADHEDPDTRAYLEAENAFTEAATAHLAPLRETLFQEIRKRTQETDLSVPSRKGTHWYYSRVVEGQQYGIHCRVPVQPAQLDPMQQRGAVEGSVLLLPAILGAQEAQPQRVVVCQHGEQRLRELGSVQVRAQFHVRQPRVVRQPGIGDVGYQLPHSLSLGHVR